jgi:2-phosphosulfolactate phosphatase
VRTVQLEWGPVGASLLGTSCAAVVVCDVLSFSSAVSVGVAHGVQVWPHPWQDSSAADRAAQLGAVLARGRGDGVSLSPASMLTLPAGAGVLLPSPNGAGCCLAAAEAGATVVAGCLRNAPAVAAWLLRGHGDIGLVPAGERWEDGSLRPAYEDWIGAGAIGALLGGSARLTPEAAAAVSAAEQRRPLAEVMSGQELVARGFAADVTDAEDYGADDIVPVLVDGVFTSV